MINHSHEGRSDLSGKRYPAAPVYVLTSETTFSAGEEVAYTLQALGRATIVGEVTGGGAHPCRPIRLHPHFIAHVSDARSINPVTKTNWEGTGVRPDNPVPAEEALETAHLAALEKLRSKIDSQAHPSAAAEMDAAIAMLTRRTR